jgi:zinc protease
VIGSVADLRAASDEDVKEFFRRYYAPNNAVLVIAGDFDSVLAKAWVAKYFGGIPRGTPIARPEAAPITLGSVRRLVYEDRVQVPRLYVQWPTVGERSDDRFALDVLGAILSGRRTARLTKALVYDQQSAASVSAGQDSNEDAGQFIMSITPRPGHTLTDLEDAAEAIITKLKAEGPTGDEVRRATAGAELDFLRGLESNLGKAEQLANGAGLHGDPGYFRTEYDKSRSVTAADVRRVVNQYFTTGRVVLSVVPAGDIDQAARSAESRNVTAEQHAFAGGAQ